MLKKQLNELVLENKNMLKDAIICSLILSKCNLVLKTHSQLSTFLIKLFVQNYNFTVVNATLQCYWPESNFII